MTRGRWQARARSWAKCLGIGLVVLQGCASNEPLVDRLLQRDRAGDVRQQLAGDRMRIGLVAARFDPEVAFPADVTNEAMLAGAIAGYGIAGLAAIAACVAMPASCPALAPVIVGGTAGGAVIGGALGEAVGDVDAEDLAVFDARTLVDAPLLQEAMRARVAAYAEATTGHVFDRLQGVGPVEEDANVDYRGSVAPGTLAVLELRVLEVGIRSRLADQYRPGMAVRARLIGVGDRRVYQDETYAVVGTAAELPQWFSDGGAQFKAWIEHAYALLAEYIVDDYFALKLPLVWPLATETSAAEGGAVPWRGPYRQLRTVTPEHAAQLADAHPVLEWQPAYHLPGQDEEAAPRMIPGARYEVRVFVDEERRQTLPGTLFGPVYRRAGLAEPRHRVEVALPPCTDYVWTVRSRFEMDGRRYVTDWSNTTGYFNQPETLSWWESWDRMLSPTIWYARFRSQCPEKGADS